MPFRAPAKVAAPAPPIRNRLPFRAPARVSAAGRAPVGDRLIAGSRIVRSGGAKATPAGIVPASRCAAPVHLAARRAARCTCVVTRCRGIPEAPPSAGIPAAVRFSARHRFPAPTDPVAGGRRSDGARSAIARPPPSVGVAIATPDRIATSLGGLFGAGSAPLHYVATTAGCAASAFGRRAVCDLTAKRPARNFAHRRPLVFERNPVDPRGLAPAIEPVVAARRSHLTAGRPVAPAGAFPVGSGRQLAPHKRSVVQFFSVVTDLVYRSPSEVAPVDYRHAVVEARVPIDIGHVNIGDVDVITKIPISVATIVAAPIPTVIGLKRRQRHPAPVPKSNADSAAETASSAPAEEADQRRAPIVAGIRTTRPPAPTNAYLVVPTTIVIGRPAPLVVAHPRPAVVVDPTPATVAVGRPADAGRRCPNPAILRRVDPPAVAVHVLCAVDVPTHILIAFAPFQVSIAALVPTVEIVHRNCLGRTELGIGGGTASKQRLAGFQPLCALRRKDFGFAVPHRHLGRAIPEHRHAVNPFLHGTYRDVRR